MTSKLPFEWVDFDTICEYCNNTGKMTNPGPEDDMGERCYYCDSSHRIAAQHESTPASTRESSPTALNPLPLTTLQATPPNVLQPPSPPLPGAEQLKFETVAPERMVCQPVRSTPELDEGYFQLYKDLIKDKILKAGLPEHLWPTNENVVKSWVLDVVRTGIIPTELRFTSAYSGPVREIQRTAQEKRFHPRVEKTWSIEGPYRKYAAYIFTNGESWWEGYPSQFLADTTDSVLLGYLYQKAMYANNATERDELLSYGAPKRRGRPKDEAAAKLREEEAQRARDAREAKRNEKEAVKQQSANAHWAWIEACRDYRLSVERERAAFQQRSRDAREEMKKELEAARIAIQHKYQEKLDQLEAALLNLEKQGAPLRGSE